MRRAVHDSRKDAEIYSGIHCEVATGANSPSPPSPSPALGRVEPKTSWVSQHPGSRAANHVQSSVKFETPSPVRGERAAEGRVRGQLPTGTLPLAVRGH